jgi:putative oxidoreductase
MLIVEPPRFFSVDYFDKFERVNRWEGPMQVQLILTQRVIAVKRWGPTFLRLVLGLIFIVHGWEKVTDLWGWMAQGQEWKFVNYVAFMPLFPPAFWAICATLAEFLGGILVFIGFRTRLAATFLAFVMFVALFGVHVPQGGPGVIGFVKEIEKPLALLAMAVCLILAGPGRYSITLKK